MLISGAWLYEEPLFAYSLGYIKRIQAETPLDKIHWWHFYSNTCLISVVFLTIVVPYLVPAQRVRCVYYSAALTFILSATVVAKLGFHSPRPFWVTTDILAFGCETEFGNPSGHSCTTMG